LLWLSLLSPIVCLFFFREAAYLAAIPFPVVEADVETIGIITLMKVVGVLAIGTFIIAASLFQSQEVGGAATALFLLMLLIQSPFLPLYFSESERDEREKLEG